MSEHNGQTGMILNIQDSRLENNQTNYNSWRMGPGWAEGGVKIIGGNPANNVVIGHVSKDNRGSGIWFDTCGSGNRIERCWLEGNTIAGIDIEASIGTSDSPNVIINNVISDSHDIPNALWPEAGGAGIMLYESGDVSILNNTLVNNDHFGIAFCGAQRKNGGYCHNIEVHNNILAGNGVAGVSFWMRGIASDPAVLATYHSDQNVWDQPEGKLGIFPNGAISNLAQLQKDAGWDAHSIAGDPHFVSAKDGNYQLAPDSPCIGKGSDMKEITPVDVK
jgi:parallel beta-helix repeat protein